MRYLPLSGKNWMGDTRDFAQPLSSKGYIRFTDTFPEQYIHEKNEKGP